MPHLRELRGLYAIVDPELCRGRDPLAVAEAILRGGCAVLQLRSKRLPPAELEPLARGLLQLCRARAVPFVVNDHAELALRIGAAGVHLGQDDLPIEAARALLGADAAIGLSTHDLDQARDAQARGADLIGFGPIFATTSKANPDPVVGVHGLRAACAAVSIPLVAIGGLTPHNAPEIAAAGARFGAAIGALCNADAPATTAALMHAALGGKNKKEI
jgi:thiamine-phosphate pyrophosphorylase